MDRPKVYLVLANVMHTILSGAKNGVGYISDVLEDPDQVDTDEYNELVDELQDLEDALHAEGKTTITFTEFPVTLSVEDWRTLQVQVCNGDIQGFTELSKKVSDEYQSNVQKLTQVVEPVVIEYEPIGDDEKE